MSHLISISVHCNVPYETHDNVSGDALKNSGSDYVRNDNSMCGFEHGDWKVENHCINISYKGVLNVVPNTKRTFGLIFPTKPMVTTVKQQVTPSPVLGVNTVLGLYAEINKLSQPIHVHCTVPTAVASFYLYILICVLLHLATTSPPCSVLTSQKEMKELEKLVVKYFTFWKQVFSSGNSHFNTLQCCVTKKMLFSPENNDDERKVGSEKVVAYRPWEDQPYSSYWPERKSSCKEYISGKV